MLPYRTMRVYQKEINLNISNNKIKKEIKNLLWGYKLKYDNSILKKPSGRHVVKFEAGSCIILDFFCVKVLYGTNQIPWGIKRTRQEHPKGPKEPNRTFSMKTAVLMQFFRERLKLLWTSQMSRYIMEPNIVNEDLEGAVRNIK